MNAYHLKSYHQHPLPHHHKYKHHSMQWSEYWRKIKKEKYPLSINVLLNYNIPCIYLRCENKFNPESHFNIANPFYLLHLFYISYFPIFKVVFNIFHFLERNFQMLIVWNVSLLGQLLSWVNTSKISLSFLKIFFYSMYLLYLKDFINDETQEWRPEE